MGKLRDWGPAFPCGTAHPDTRLRGWRNGRHLERACRPKALRIARNLPDGHRRVPLLNARERLSAKVAQLRDVFMGEALLNSHAAQGSPE